MVQDITIEVFGKITRIYKKLLRKFYEFGYDPQQNIHYIISSHLSKNNINKVEGAQIPKLTHILDHSWLVATCSVQSLEQNILKISNLFIKKKNQDI